VLSGAPCPGAAPAVAVNTYAGQGYADEPVTAGFGRDELTKLPGGRPNLTTRGGTLTFTSDVLTKGAALDLAGMPALHLVVTSLAGLPAGGEQVRGTAASFQLDPKLWDVAPDGAATLITRGAFAERLDANAVNPSWSPIHTVSFDLFGLSYLIPAGHRVRLTLSTDDSPYLRPTPNPFTVAVLAGSAIDLPSAAALAAP
jgi:predicted acyl esterase